MNNKEEQFNKENKTKQSGQFQQTSLFDDEVWDAFWDFDSLQNGTDSEHISFEENPPKEFSKDDFSQKSIDNSKTLFEQAKDSYNKVDDKLLDFIGNFVDNQKEVAEQKLKLKKIFFWFTMPIFAGIVLTPIFCLVLLAIFKVENLYVIFGSIVASLVEVLTTIIILPKIVAEYLFNKEEEKTNLQIVELMQRYSDTMHGYDK